MKEVNMLKCKLNLTLLLSVFLGLAITYSSSFSMPKADKAPIKLGMSTALSGKDAPIALGEGSRFGIDIYLQQLNAAGGIGGRKVELIALDDQYIPEISAKNVRTLIEKYHVLAIIGNKGSANAVVTAPITDANHVLFYAGYGVDTLVHRKLLPNRYVINFMARYDDIVTQSIKGLMSIGIKPDEMAFLLQNDPFGDTIYEDVLNALKALGYSKGASLPWGRYNRGSVNIEDGLATILHNSRMRAHPIKAIITAGVGPANTKFFRITHNSLPKAFFVAIPGDIQNIPYDKEGIQLILMQVVPPLDSNLPAVREYREAMKKYGNGAPLDIHSLYGYLIMKLMAIALQQANDKHDLTREGIINAFENMHNLDIGIGIPISLSPSQHQVLHQAWPVLMKDNDQAVSIKWSDLKNLGVQH
jgi:ABC-type branched-subunit amino acid transport system substrate-binding protein